MANFENMNQTFNARFSESVKVGSSGTGADGASAYEVAVKNGFKGSEEEWLESLKGEPGADGKDGADGQPGEPGKDGQPGADGKDYVLTESDKTEIAEMAAGLVEVPESGGIEVTGASVGQTIVVKAVDDNGKPTEWETADLPQGGGGSEMRLIHIEDIPTGNSFVECIVTTDDDGKPFSINRLIVEFSNLTSQYANKVFVNDVEVTQLIKSGTNATYTAHIEYLGDAYFHIRTIQAATNVTTIWEANSLRVCDMPITKIAVKFTYPSWQEGAKLKIFGG